MSLFWLLVASLVIPVAIALKLCNVRWKRDEHEKEYGSWFGHIGFELFGEIKFLIWLGVFAIYFKIVIVMVVVRLLIKYW